MGHRVGWPVRGHERCAGRQRDCKHCSRPGGRIDVCISQQGAKVCKRRGGSRVWLGRNHSGGEDRRADGEFQHDTSKRRSCRRRPIQHAAGSRIRRKKPKRADKRKRKRQNVVEPRHWRCRPNRNCETGRHWRRDKRTVCRDPYWKLRQRDCRH